ncbi:MAG: tRNA (guanosine(37)-N1)-methyltransferase TrmD [Patescibacteria group bacterium]|jgi:tRNA (guanine37-N1)-methyltransferase|nr:tRNA (guanosine(37)-N1)-methyltransferase TrmD [Patescibacteria group bacterium]
MTFHIISIFPGSFESYFNVGILSRAIEKEKIKLKLYNLRDFTKDKHKKVDDAPYGGGPGMVMSVQPIYNCVDFIKKNLQKDGVAQDKIKTVLFSAKGEVYNQKKAKDLTEYEHLIFICGRYEGVDERVIKNIADEELSIGEYILSGGELPSMIVVDSVSRLLPEVLGNRESLEVESYNDLEKNIIDYPVYTRPDIFNDWRVPNILLEGNHAEIDKWRNQKQKNKNEKN